jgi:hypothetical protein
MTLARAYLATAINLASRQVVGWALADHMRSKPWKGWSHGTREPASKRYPPGLKERAVRMVIDLKRADPADHVDTRP